MSGEHSVRYSRGLVAWGSSPRERGALLTGMKLYWETGIIPA